MTTSYYKSIKNYQRPQSSLAVHVPQPFINYKGLTQKLNSDLSPENPTQKKPSNNFIGPLSIKKLNPAERRSISTRQKFEENQKRQSEREKKLFQRALMNKTNPNNVSEAQNSFWMTHINSSNIYHSFIKGSNPWARSSAFTQPIQRTRGALGFYQNAFNNSMLCGFPGFFSENKKLLIDKEIEKIQKCKKRTEIISANGIRQFIVDKILEGCKKKGWIGFRSLNCYLRKISPHDCDVIDKNSFKFYLDKFGIRLELSEINEICEIFDKNKNGHINFVEFLNSLRFISDERKQEIDEFFEQVKEKNNDNNIVLLSKLKKISDMRFHPEAIRYRKNENQIKFEYENYWDKLKINDIISEESFRQYFYDISSAVENDKDFTQILKALGYK